MERIFSTQKAINKNDIKRVWLTDDAIWIETFDGKQGCEKYADYKSLRAASEQERHSDTMSYFGLHWPMLDEDLSYEGFFAKDN